MASGYNLPDDWSWRAFDEYNGRYDEQEVVMNDYDAGEDQEPYLPFEVEFDDLFAPPNVIHDGGVE